MDACFPNIFKKDSEFNIFGNRPPAPLSAAPSESGGYFVKCVD
jgi:hypothetical protein